jgi:hypothetical protein
MGRPTRADKIKRDEALKYANDEINSIKSRLIAVHYRLSLVNSGCTVQAASLDRIVARLEAWQAETHK